MKVLVVEDDPDIQVILKMVLTRLGKCEIQQTFQGNDVLDLARQFNPQLILLDVMLPEANGFDICQALKADAQLQSIPVIFLTARTVPDDVHRMKTVGAIGNLAKPFDPMTLIPQINELISPLGVTIG